jgi:tripartite ATP-independent transporter DctP family solute receptor
MMLKKFKCLFLVMVLILVTVSCTTFAAVKPIKIILGHQWYEKELYVQKGDLYFKKLVEENSKGQILVDIYCGGQLGTIPEQIQAVKTNAQQMTYTPVGEFVPYWRKLATFDLPYLYRDQKHFLKVAEKFTSLVDKNEMAAKTGLRIIGVRIRAPRHLVTNFPVNKLEDIKGLKIRVSQSPISVALWKAFGTTPTVLPGTEIYTALATGTVDAQENPLAHFYINRNYEVVKYCALTAHKWEIIPIVISETFWKSLTRRQRKIIQDATDKSNNRLTKLVLEDETKYKKLLEEKGMKFTKPDVGPFREKAKTIWSQFSDAEMIKKVQAIK